MESVFILSWYAQGQLRMKAALPSFQMRMGSSSNWPVTFDGEYSVSAPA